MGVHVSGNGDQQPRGLAAMDTAHLETDGELLELKAAPGSPQQALGTFFLRLPPRHIFLGPLHPRVLVLIPSVHPIL